MNVKPWHIVALLIIIAVGVFISRVVKAFRDGQNKHD